MSAITNYLGVGIAAAVLAGAAPAAAQYYPGYPSPYGYGSPNGYGYGSPNGYGYNAPGYAYGTSNQAMVGQCTSAVQARLSGGYGGYGASPYGGGPYGGGRVLGVTRVEPGRNGGFTVRGVATSGYSGYGYGANSPNLVWLCRTDFRGVVVDIDVEQARSNNGYRSPPGNYDYSPYGYQRY